MKDVEDWDVMISTQYVMKFLKKYYPLSIYTRNIQILMTEKYKLAKGVFPTIIQEILRFWNNKN